MAEANDTQATTDATSASKTKKPLGRGAAVVIALIAALVGAGGFYGILSATGQLATTRVQTTTSGSKTTQNITINPASDDATIAEAVAAKALPSVCSITVTTSAGTGMGSGVVLDTDGNIITNYHVVQDAQSLSVNLNNQTYEGTIVGYDSDTDLAVVHIDAAADDLTPVEVGNSNDLVVGDWVMTIGSPYGLDQSASIGIVSSLYRSTMLSSYSSKTIYANLIQTDAAINPGNSGGALVNDQGQLVGINTLNASNSGASAGVGFAIPGNYAVKVAKTLIAGDVVEHPYIGVSVQTVGSQNSGYGFGSSSTTQGAYVGAVTDGGPAADAGIEVGDVITKVDDEEIASADALILAIRSHEIGDTVTLTVVRNNKSMEIKVKLAAEADSGTDGKSSDTSNDNRGSFGFDWGDIQGNQSKYATGTIEVDGVSYDVAALRQEAA